MFGLLSCIEAANCGRLDEWVHRYLSDGPWANAALRDGLRLQRRYWLGPLLVPLQKLERCCGPEPGMEFPVPIDAWENKISGIASGLTDPRNLSPLIVEWRADVLSVRDGSCRHAANDRIAIYFRVWLKGIEHRRWELLTNIWSGWRL